MIMPQLVELSGLMDLETKCGMMQMVISGSVTSLMQINLTKDIPHGTDSQMEMETLFGKDGIMLMKEQVMIELTSEITGSTIWDLKPNTIQTTEEMNGSKMLITMKCSPQQLEQFLSPHSMEMDSMNKLTGIAQANQNSSSPWALLQILVL
jgi:hypothetical protein